MITVWDDTYDLLTPGLGLSWSWGTFGAGTLPAAEVAFARVIVGVVTVVTISDGVTTRVS